MDSKEISERLITSSRVVLWLAAVVGLMFLFPIAYLTYGTATLGSEFWATVTSRTTLLPLWNSIRLAVTTTIACVTIGTSLAFLVARTDLPGRKIWRILLPLPLAVPSFVGATALLAALGPGSLLAFVPRVDGFWGAFLVLTFLSYPYVYLPVLARLASTSPALEEASQLLGGSRRRTLGKVLLPQIRSSIVAGGLLVFLYVLSDFGAVALLRYNAITRAIFSSRLFDRSTALTLGLLLAVLALVVAATQRIMTSKRSTSTDAHVNQVRYRLDTLRPAAMAAVATPVVVGLFLPVMVFLFWVFRGTVTVGAGYGGWGDDLTFLGAPLVNSAGAAVVAALAAVVVVLPVSYVGARARGWLPASATAAVSSVFALPGLVVALALVFWSIQAPGALALIYQSFPLLILAYVMHFGAQSMQASQAAIANLPRVFDEAARTLGASRLRRFLTVDLPLIRPGLVAGGGLVLLSTLKELPATLLLAPIGFQTLATKIWGAAEDGFFAEVGITALVLIALSAALTWMVVLRRQPVELVESQG